MTYKTQFVFFHARICTTLGAERRARGQRATKRLRDLWHPRAMHMPRFLLGPVTGGCGQREVVACVASFAIAAAAAVAADAAAAA